MNEELNNVVSEQPEKNNFNKKMFLIIGVIVAVIAVVGIFIGKSFLGKKEDEVVDKYATSEITGEVELAMKSTDKISRFVEYNKGYQNLEHFTGKDKDGNVAVFDAAGNILLPVKGTKLYKENNMFFKYLGDGYFIYNTLEGENGIGTVIVKNSEIVADLSDYGLVYIGYSHYKDGILYAAINTGDYSFAYDIEAKKELWRLDDSEFVQNYALDKEFIRLQSKVNPTKDDVVYSETIPNTILDFDGNKIVSGADLSPREGSTSLYDSRILTSTASTYYELKDDDYIKVYDLKGNLKSTISLKETESVRYYLARVLKSGLFLVMETDKTTSKMVDVIYNTEGKEILRGTIDLLSYDYGSFVADYNFPNEFELFDVIDESGSSCVLVKNGEVVGKYGRCANAISSYNKTNDYIMVFDKDSENPVTYNGETYKILNIHTMKTTTAPVKYTYYTGIENIGLNGKYVILKEDKDGKYYVYDEELNKKYESEDKLIPVNDKYVLKTDYSLVSDAEEFEYALVNIETGEENDIDVKGKYQTSNSRGLVTYDGEFYYLYTFK